MKNKIIRNAISYFLILFLINFMCYVLCGKDKISNNIIAYIGLNLGIVVLFIITVLNSKNKRFPESVALPYFTSIIFAVICFIFNALLLFIDKGYGILACNVNIILFVVFIFIYHRLSYYSKEIEESEIKLEEDREFVKKTSEILKVYLYNSSNSMYKDKIEKVYDALRVSPVNSNEESKKYEIEISEIIKHISDFSDDEIASKMDEIYDLIVKRNLSL